MQVHEDVIQDLLRDMARNRNTVQCLDEQIIKLIARRMLYAFRIGKAKRDLGMDVFIQEVREANLRKMMLIAKEEGVSETLIDFIYQGIYAQADKEQEEDKGRNCN